VYPAVTSKPENEVLENKHALQIWASGHAEATVNFGGVGDLDLHPVRTKKPCFETLEQRSTTTRRVNGEYEVVVGFVPSSLWKKGRS